MKYKCCACGTVRQGVTPPREWAEHADGRFLCGSCVSKAIARAFSRHAILRCNFQPMPFYRRLGWSQ